MLTLQFSEREASILRLALCRSAPEGEWQAAAIALIRIARNHSLTIPEWKTQAAAQEASPIVGFGKYKDKTVHWIVNNDPSYAEWVLAKLKKLSSALRKEFDREMEARYK